LEAQILGQQPAKIWVNEMGTRAHHASAGQSPACCLKGKETKEKQRKKKQDQTTTKDKNDTEGICAAESAMEFRRLRVFDDCAS